MNSLPLNDPGVPAFARESFKHEIKTKAENIAYDDLWSLNTQSGTQWDGFRHASHRRFALHSTRAVYQELTLPSSHTYPVRLSTTILMVKISRALMQITNAPNTFGPITV